MRTTPKPKPRRATNPREWSDIEVMRSRLRAAEAERAAFLAAMPAHDAEVSRRVVDTLLGSLREILPKRDQTTADAVVANLGEQGLLRQKPAATGVIRRVVRDEAGRIVSMVEAVEQIEPPPPEAPVE